jgi:poly-gamma-glutamate synthesis protein (capsule biosynthesis protein)
VITSFQYYETYAPKPFAAQLRDFRLMADAGATIVQGSQAHYPQTMEFYKGAFVHYGLGNLFFDQMGDDSAEFPTRREFMDRHVFYDGHYISTELLTALLEDYARPVPMTAHERSDFLSKYFDASGW